jgi:hypothetical protein
VGHDSVELGVVGVGSRLGGDTLERLAIDAEVQAECPRPCQVRGLVVFVGVTRVA